MKIQKSAIKNRNRNVMADTDVAEEAVDLLFEAPDVAELLADVSGEDVEVTAENESVVFDVGGETYTCEAEPNDEVVESSTRILPQKRRIAASTRKPVGKTVRKLPRRK